MKRAPKDLGPDGRRLWREHAAVYEFSPAEVEALRHACRVADIVARLDAELAGSPVTVEGSMGQLRPHPLLQASAEQRKCLDMLLRSLNLPLPGESAGRRQSPQQREAAQQRWRQRKDGHG